MINGFAAMPAPTWRKAYKSKEEVENLAHIN
jgi:hypothetical protein